MSHDADHRIRERAYHLWEAAGRPHGREHEFWVEANRLEREGAAPPPPAKKASAAKAKPADKPAAAKAKPAEPAKPAAKPKRAGTKK